jgi:hypothetical protein
VIASALVRKTALPGRWCAIGLSIALVYLLGVAWLPERVYLSVFQCAVLALLGVWLLLVGAGRLRFRFHPVVAAAWALPLWGAVQLACGTSVYRQPTALAILDWTVVAGVATLSFQLASTSQFRQPFRTGLIGTALVVTAFSLLHWYTSPGLLLWWKPNPYILRSPFPLLNHTHFAALVELAIALVAWEALESRTPFRFHSWAAGLMMGAVFAVGARSGSAIVAVELVILAVRHLAMNRTVDRRMRALTVLLPAFALVLAIGWQGLAGRAKSAPRDDLRPLFTQSTLDMIRARPLAGFGLGNWATAYPAFARVDPDAFVEHAHDDWLEWAAEGGIPFLIIMLGVATWAVRRGWSNPQWLGIAAIFIQALFEFPLHKPVILVFQFAALGCLAASRSTTAVEVIGTRTIDAK